MDQVQPFAASIPKTKSAVKVLVTDCSADDATSFPTVDLGDGDDDENETISKGSPPKGARRRNTEDDDADDEALSTLARVS